MKVLKNDHLLEQAREFRSEMTPQEKKLWYRFLRGHEQKIYKQRIIDSFIVDFYCARARLVVEIDGPQHHSEQGLAYDVERTAILEQYDLMVLRFTNEEVDRQFPEVCAKIDRTIQARLAESFESGLRQPR